MVMIYKGTKVQLNGTNITKRYGIIITYRNAFLKRMRKEMEQEIPIRIGTTFCPRSRHKFDLERETRFELATFCLGSRHSTTELLPPENGIILTQKIDVVKNPTPKYVSTILQFYSKIYIKYDI
jgi:hypothetical protein